MRFAALFFLFASPAFAWDFASSPVCTLSHQTDKANLTISYDARSDAPYAIEITQGEAVWKPGPVFMMGFDGPRRSMITTDRHRLGASGKSLTVKDQGFGNLLDGIEHNYVALARSGETSLVFSLTGAASAVRRFKVCVASSEI